MSQQALSDVMQRLNCGDREAGFLEYLPESAQSEIIQGINDRLDRDQKALDESVSEGLEKMPGWLRTIAKFILD